MASLDALPPDQRAVLALVLQRGRSYDEIAGLLSIDRAAVRDRALGALDALGPTTRVAPERRALITDYLLGQLPDRVRDLVRDSLASSASERAWARVLAGELARLASKPLPEIPSGQATEPRPAQETVARSEQPAPSTTPEPAADLSTRIAAATKTEAPRQQAPISGQPQPVAAQRPSSRRGGAILLALALGALIVIAVVIVVIATSGSSTKSTPIATRTTSTATTPTGTTGTTTTSTKPKIIAQVNLRPPSGTGKAIGIADVVTSGKITALIVAAAHVPPNSAHNAYAIWLYTPGGAAKLLGYVSPGVGKNGQLKTTGRLPADAATFKDLLVTLETTTSNKAPGPVVLQGPLGLSAG